VVRSPTIGLTGERCIVDLVVDEELLRLEPDDATPQSPALPRDSFEAAPLR
jgi:hypothetical protein